MACISSYHLLDILYTQQRRRRSQPKCYPLPSTYCKYRTSPYTTARTTQADTTPWSHTLDSASRPKCNLIGSAYHKQKHKRLHRQQLVPTPVSTLIPCQLPRPLHLPSKHPTSRGDDTQTRAEKHISGRMGAPRDLDPADAGAARRPR